MNDNETSTPQTDLETRREENQKETELALKLAAEAKERDRQAGILPPEQFIAAAVLGKLQREEFHEPREDGEGQPTS